MAQSQVQAVPRVGVSFTNTVTEKCWIESVDADSRTIVFTTPQGSSCLPGGTGAKLASYKSGQGVECCW